ncbi:hypothetical protein CFC21_082258 [Triticum aestivum]|uniref:Photosystem II 5 kDa protein, chloroplastic n=3 Tax=Triticum TaxID=4564 RepID=A0A9R0XUZ9_TRITD|nr:photosystem II 5 kDa protein, chloroplastic-like [Triticum dicoccoides]XP_044407673.1 photosystem II 5 kDa protein, chloroplastic-like [Triticum aestivum]XP_048535662.1 photosystem II 5 kDa protein, chloroplastic-like [Triticum urartu]KAF7077736.1 hypothetical protein CFC21_082258 [Triticum aestivum]VAI42951.1 unnamed protein product [Triticum turgidum subsp. durum]
MASLTMMASLSAAVAVDRRAAAPRRGLVVARAAKVEGQQEPAAKMAAVEPATDGRRAVVFAAAAAALSAIGGVAFAESDVKKGSPEAKKKYAPVCITMPTAKICHN